MKIHFKDIALPLLKRCALVLIALMMLNRHAAASGEIVAVRGPDVIAEGDDITVLVSATAREKGINRTIVIDCPKEWKIKRAYAVEAGAEQAAPLPRSSEITARFSIEAGREVIAFEDYADDFDEEAPGVAYFFQFSTKGLASSVQSASIRAALVERIDPNSPPEIDKKSKKPKPRNLEWRVVSPLKYEYSFSGVAGKRFTSVVHILRVPRTGRALLVAGDSNAVAELHTRPEVLASFFSSPFSLQFWLKTSQPNQTILSMSRSDDGVLQFGTNLLGQLTLRSKSGKGKQIVLLSGKAVSADGAWHYIVISRDSLAKLRLFIDAQQAAIADLLSDLFDGVGSFAIGKPHTHLDFTMDELRLINRGTTDSRDFEALITRSARDTLKNAFAVFHFDEYGGVARSSIPYLVRTDTSDKGQFIPVYLVLDSNARIAESTSPVMTDRILMSADLISPTRVSISWRSSSELGIKRYNVERRIGSYGRFEKVLSIDAKHGEKSLRRGQSLISYNSYSATEDLPKLSGDIELYYRISITGFEEPAAKKDESGAVIPEEIATDYSEPIKLEYGGDRDVFVEQNQPNPFNPTTSIGFRAIRPTVVKIAVYDIIGREVSVLYNGKAEPGRHTYTLDGTNWPGGIYFYRVKTPKVTVTRKMVLAK